MFGSIKEIDAAQLADWMENNTEPFRIIDVREMGEIARGIIPGARPLPLATLPIRISELDRSEKFVLVCHSGGRSAQACMFLQQQGFENVFNLRGGMIGWAHGNLPIEQAAVA